MKKKSTKIVKYFYLKVFIEFLRLKKHEIVMWFRWNSEEILETLTIILMLIIGIIFLWIAAVASMILSTLILWIIFDRNLVHLKAAIMIGDPPLFVNLGILSLLTIIITILTCLLIYLGLPVIRELFKDNWEMAKRNINRNKK